MRIFKKAHQVEKSLKSPFANKNLDPKAANLYYFAINNPDVGRLHSEITLHNPLTGLHCYNAARAAAALAIELDKPRKEARNIVRAAFLHDLGLVSIEPSLLNKQSSFTKYDRELIATHPSEGYAKMHIEGIDSKIALTSLLHHRFQPDPYPNDNELNRVLYEFGVIGTFVVVLGLLFDYKDTNLQV